MTRISPAEAWEKMNAGVPYVDVRRPDEFVNGRPKGALNVPLDERFAETIAERFGKDAPIIVGCEVGGRSLRAAKALVAAGFTQVFDQRAGWDAAKGAFGEVVENGWSRVGLPHDAG